MFHLLLTLSTTFLVLYAVGVSVPGWYLYQETVHNLSMCTTADKFLGPEERDQVSDEGALLTIYSSLWYLQIHVEDGAKSFQKTVPFIYIQNPQQVASVANGLMLQRVMPFSLTPVFMFLFLSLAIAFIIIASQRSSHRVYYGLATIFLDAAMTVWMILSTPSSEGFLFSVASSFCVKGGQVQSSVTLMIATGSCAIVAFLLGSILIHIALVLQETPSQCHTDILGPHAVGTICTKCDVNRHGELVNYVNKCNFLPWIKKSDTSMLNKKFRV